MCRPGCYQSPLCLVPSHSPIRHSPGPYQPRILNLSWIFSNLSDAPLGSLITPWNCHQHSDQWSSNRSRSMMSTRPKQLPEGNRFIFAARWTNKLTSWKQSSLECQIKWLWPEIVMDFYNCSELGWKLWMSPTIVLGPDSLFRFSLPQYSLDSLSSSGSHLWSVKSTNIIIKWSHWVCLIPLSEVAVIGLQ